ncbi:allophanate hydrolase subunit 1 [Rathayibacter sp. VKM Ac-2878]|nr:allophanate hydrolase subunit 1 [Rathayibacter sp. VKM Ac-2879]MBF4503096.1 allophanate hydrolase subunit 1 [Rathayibacter sp. VKM Ac-2878]
MAVELLPSGDRALLVEVDVLDAALALSAALDDARPDGVIDLVPAASTVLVVLDPAVLSVARAERWIRDRAESATPDRARVAGRVVDLPVRYDGPDLDQTAALLGWSVGELVRRHSGTRWRAAFGGFAPGFAYLVALDAWPEVPRRAEPRTRVPAGTVALASGYSGVYPRASPGGWQLIGSTEAVLWDTERMPPALLAPGDEVCFRAVP